MTIVLQDFGDFLTAFLIVGGGPVLIAYGMFRFLGQKWIESKFAAQLENERHEHAKELQELKRKLDSELSRVIKLQDREFLVLTEVWDKLRDALDHVYALMSIGRAYPDLSKMGKERLDEFLAASPLTSVHRAEVVAADDKNKQYQQLIFWYDLHAAKQTAARYRAHVIKNSIFLRAELGNDFEAICGILWDALIAREVGEEARDMAMWIEAARKMRDRIEPLLLNLHTTVRTLLRAGV